MTESPTPLNVRKPIDQFGKMGEKTGWRYISISPAESENLNPGVRVSYRVRGRLDALPVRALALIPIGEGEMILPLNADLRKKLGKDAGALVHCQLEADFDEIPLDPEFLELIAEVPEADAYFQTLAPSHRAYFSRWIESAKTRQTREKRLVQAVSGLAKNWDYGTMIRMGKGR